MPRQKRIRSDAASSSHDLSKKIRSEQASADAERPSSSYSLVPLEMRSLAQPALPLDVAASGKKGYIIKDIDGVVVGDDDRYKMVPEVREFLLKYLEVIEFDFTLTTKEGVVEHYKQEHFLAPGTLEATKFAHENTNMQVIYCSAGVKERNEAFVAALLTKVFGAAWLEHNKPIIVSRDDTIEVMVESRDKTSYKIRKKDITKVLRVAGVTEENMAEAISNTIMFDNDANSLVPGQEANFVLVSTFSKKMFMDYLDQNPMGIIAQNSKELDLLQISTRSAHSMYSLLGLIYFFSFNFKHSPDSAVKCLAHARRTFYVNRMAYDNNGKGYGEFSHVGYFYDLGLGLAKALVQKASAQVGHQDMPSPARMTFLAQSKENSSPPPTPSLSLRLNLSRQGM